MNTKDNHFCIVGLGNPGIKYEQTRHNAGFLFLDFLAQKWSLSWDKKNTYHLSKYSFSGSVLFFLKPMQFMNLSGHAVREIIAYYKIPIKNILICYDDMAFKIGDYRLKPKGSSGGHNGLASIMEQLGTQEIPRLRIGITPMQKPQMEMNDFVLSRFSSQDISDLQIVFKDGQKVVESFVQKGLDKTMSIVNHR